jgi:hypothetical protein
MDPSPELDEALSREVAAWMIREGGRAPLARRSNGVHVIDFSDAPSLYSRIGPHRRTILLVLLLAIRDRAGELRFEPCVSEAEGRMLRMFYEVNGELLELVSPPAGFVDYILTEVKTIAGFHTGRRRLAGLLRRLARRLDGQVDGWPQSRFQVRAGDAFMDISATVYPSEIGDRVFFDLSGCPAILQERAQRAQREIFDKGAEFVDEPTA